MNDMTIDEIMASNKDMLTPSDVAPILNCHPYAISVQAREDASKLGFPVCVVGRRTKIPKQAFLNWLSGTTIQDNIRP